MSKVSRRQGKVQFVLLLGANLNEAALSNRVLAVINGVEDWERGTLEGLS
jgi:hypothetical protein